jgi:ketosteroid isomerase-like protein/NTP pyrophosphatase (non-canonical NTP hydrolase)
VCRHPPAHPHGRRTGIGSTGSVAAVTLDELQELMERLYGAADRERGIAATVAWLCEELGELAQAVRKGTPNEQLHELGDVLAWTASLANQLDLSLSEAVERYETADPPEPLESQPDEALRSANTALPFATAEGHDRPMGAEMGTEQTRELVAELWDVLGKGDRDRLLEILDPDVVWNLPRSVPDGNQHRGAETVADQLGGDLPKRMFDMRTFRPTIRKLLADGDTAVVLLNIQATTKTGADYDNEYAWVYTVADGRITEITEYADTLVAARAMGWEL